MRPRTHLNFEIAPGGKVVPMGTNKKIGDRFRERCEELCLGDPNFKTDKETGKPVATNRVTTAWVQFGGSREQIAAMQKEQQETAERHSRELEEAKRLGAEEEQRKFANMSWIERIQKK